jgi:PPOX class probable F420-dependent enzyme
LDLQEARDYLRANHRAVLATMRRDGTPQMSPVACAVLASGDVVVSSRETAIKTKNVRRDPRAWLCVFPDAFFGGFVQVEGDVTVVSLPDAMEGLVDYYRAVAGEHPDWDDYRAAMERDQRVIISITPERVSPTVQG